MKEAEPKPIRLADYQPPDYRILETRLLFEIRSGVTTVENRMRVERAEHAAAGAPLVLDGEDLELVTVAVDGVEVSGNGYRVDDESLTLFDVPADAEVTVVTRISPETNTALEGLYKSGSMYCTQCEAEGFRKITYYLDRPDVLSRFTTTIEADRDYPVLLSNGNLVAEGDAGAGRRRVTWEDPFPKPSYLFALVAGDLALLEDEFVTCTGRKVALRIYSEPHNIGQCGYAMDVLKRAMRWDEERFGREYDLDVFMIVAVEDFNMGAMENKGLNIFNTSCVLATPDTATDAGYQRVEGVVAHEYFHNWSGNRVTCRDWFQLSLKEGFTVFRDQEFSSDMNSRTVKRIEDVHFLRSVQFAEDSGPMAHPVRPDSYIEISNFYTPTVYDKGSEVVRMLYTLLGPERFRQGTDLYFERHDGSAVTTDDFLAAMADVTDVDLGQFRLWYEQAGTPLLEVSEAFSDGTFVLTIRQSCAATPGQSRKAPLHIPVAIGLLNESGGELAGPELGLASRCRVERRGTTLMLHVTEPEVELEVSGLDAPPVVSFLRGFSAPVRVDYPRADDRLAFLALHDGDGFARWDALQTRLVNELVRLQDGAEVGAPLVDLFAELLGLAKSAPDDPEQKFMLAALLTLPDEGYLFEQLAPVDVDALCGARDRLAQALAEELRDHWLALYEANAARGPFSADAGAMARRALRNTALGYVALGATGDALATTLESHYRNADNLTDRRAALREIVDADGVPDTLRAGVLDDFRQRWRSEALVMDVWFAVQASSRRSGVDTILGLEAHEAFDGRNPNKLRAVYGAFGQQNHRNFHAADGSGYDLLAERILRLDGANPQVAARLLTPLTRWRRYDPARQRLMQRALGRIAECDELSRDVYEVVVKSLPRS